MAAPSTASTSISNSIALISLSTSIDPRPGLAAAGVTISPGEREHRFRRPDPYRRLFLVSGAARRGLGASGGAS